MVDVVFPSRDPFFCCCLACHGQYSWLLIVMIFSLLITAVHPSFQCTSLLTLASFGSKKTSQGEPGQYAPPPLDLRVGDTFGRLPVPATEEENGRSTKGSKAHSQGHKINGL